VQYGDIVAGGQQARIGARQRLEGEVGRVETSMSAQIVKQVRMELEEVLLLLRR
jgi:hypothetical protein